MSEYTLISILNGMKGKNGYHGHNRAYIEGVCASANKLSWNYKVYYPSFCKLIPPPKNWFPYLHFINPSTKISLIRRFKKTIGYLFFYLKHLKKELSSNKKSILFFENLEPIALTSLLLALPFLQKKHLHIWLLFRYNPSIWGERKNKFIKILINLFNKILLKNRVVLLTDTISLAKVWSLYFNQNVPYIPSPRMLCSSPPKKLLNNDLEQTICFWPGFPRPAKGLDIIKNIASSKEKCAPNFLLVLSEKARINSTKLGPHIHNLSHPLPLEDYESIIKTSHFILLPYDPKTYSHGSSYIFMEAIILGKIPLVTDETWMAFELKQFKLEGLILDWSSKTIFKKMESLRKNNSVLEKLEKMKIYYTEYHSPDSFAKEMLSFVT